MVDEKELKSPTEHSENGPAFGQEDESGNPVETSLEKKPETVTEKESGREYEEALKKVQAQAGQDAGFLVQDAEKVFHQADADTQIKHLVEIATAKGPVYAIKVANHLDDNYVLDMFHDKLVSDELRKILLQKGLLKDN